MRTDREIREAIGRVLDAETSDFVELTKLAALNPATAFRYANLSGADFSGLDLSGFDFTGSNLTNCVFSDARIAKANFSLSIFNRADLVSARDFCEYLNNNQDADVKTTRGKVSGAKNLLVHVIDDDDAVRDTLFSLLRSAGFAVRTHHCAQAFFEDYHAEETGCILVDMRMPDMTGLDVQERISCMGDAPPIIIITGHADIRMAITVMKRGAVEFLEKPIDPQILLDHVDEAVKRREYALGEVEKVEEAQARIGILTPREKDVLKHLLIGRPNKIIARELGLSPRTVEIHRARVMEKTGAGSLPRLVRMALAAGLDPELPH